MKEVTRSIMLPSLSPLSTSTGAVRVPPPPSFRPIRGSIRLPQFTTLGDFKKHDSTAAQLSGMRYEKKVHSYLQGVFKDRYLANQPLKFYDASGLRFCVPDALLLWDKYTVIFEIKFQHTPEAWWQLRQLYQPVVEALNRDVKVHVVEICRSFDPATPFPEEVNLIYDLSEYCFHPLESFAVFRWKK